MFTASGLLAATSSWDELLEHTYTLTMGQAYQLENFYNTN